MTNKEITTANLLPQQVLSIKEASTVGTAMGKSTRHHYATSIISLFNFIFSSIGLIGLIAIDTKLLAGTLGETIWNRFGEGGMAMFIPLALIMIAAFAKRLISKQSDDELKKSWLGRLVNRLANALLFSLAVLFSVTMLESLYPSSISLPQDSGSWGQSADEASEAVETLTSEFAVYLSPFAEGIFSIVSGGILIITAFLLMILMDWWIAALKVLVVGRKVYRTRAQLYEQLKELRKRYIPLAYAVNTQAPKTLADHEMEFALYFISRGLEIVGKARKTLPDHELRKRIENPSWSEIGEDATSADPQTILSQREKLTRSLELDKILTILRRTQA